MSQAQVRRASAAEAARNSAMDGCEQLQMRLDAAQAQAAATAAASTEQLQVAQQQEDKLRQQLRAMRAECTKALDAQVWQVTQRMSLLHISMLGMNNLHTAWRLAHAGGALTNLVLHNKLSPCKIHMLCEQAKYVRLPVLRSFQHQGCHMPMSAHPLEDSYLHVQRQCRKQLLASQP